MAGNIVFRGNPKITVTPGSGSGQPILTLNSSTGLVGEVGPIDPSTYLTTTLASGQIIVGNAGNIATAVTPSGAVLFSNTGVTTIAPAVITSSNLTASAGVLYTQLNLSNSILNSDISSSASIGRSKLASGTANVIIINNGSGVMSEASPITALRVIVSDANGLPTASSVTSTTLSYVDISTSLTSLLANKLAFASSITPANGDLISYISGSWNRVALGTAGQYLVVNPGGTGVQWTSAPNGVPVGGTAGQFLNKIDATNYNTQWSTLTTSLITDLTVDAAQVNSLSNFIASTGLATGTTGQALTVSGGGLPVWATLAGTGTVTSINVSGGTTGLTTSGGPITSSGTITIAGLLGAVNGGTGQSAVATGDILYGSAVNTWSRLSAGTNTYVLTMSGGIPVWAPAAGGGSGTVTSVGLSVPSFLSVSGSPITTSGTLSISLSGTPLPVTNGGTGTSTPGLIAGSNITITGSWPNQTINASGGGSTAYPVTGTGTLTSAVTIAQSIYPTTITGTPTTGNFIFNPSLANGTSYYPFVFNGSGTQTIPFVFKQSRADFNTVSDNIMIWGYNPDSEYDATKSGIAYRMEYWYAPSSPTDVFIENHLQWVWPSAFGGGSSRLFSSTLRVGSTLAASSNEWDFRGTTVNWMDLSGNVWAGMSPGSFQIGNTAGTYAVAFLSDPITTSSFKIYPYAGTYTNGLDLSNWTTVVVSGLNITGGTITAGGSGQITLANNTTTNPISCITQAGLLVSGSSGTQTIIGGVFSGSTKASISVNFGTGEIQHFAATGGYFQTFYANATKILQLNSTSVNPLQMYVGNFTTSPTALLHLAAGTASAGSSPLKLTAGINMSTPEDGAIEYGSSHLYFTIGSTRYQLDQQSSSGLTISNTSITTSTTLSNTANTIYNIFVDCTSGNIVLTLPTAVATVIYNIKRIDSSSNTVTFSGTIDGNSSYLGTTGLLSLNGVIINNNGTNYYAN